MEIEHKSEVETISVSRSTNKDIRAQAHVKEKSH